MRQPHFNPLYLSNHTFLIVYVHTVQQHYIYHSTLEFHSDDGGVYL